MARTSQVGYLRRHHPHVEIVEAQTMLDLMSAVLSGKADLLIATLPVVQHFMAENLIGGLRISGVFQSDELDSLHIAVRNDAPLLRDILDQAIADIGREERRTIMARWLPPVALEQQDRQSKRLNSSH